MFSLVNPNLPLSRLPDHDQPVIEEQSQVLHPVAVPPVRPPLREISLPLNPSFNPTYNDDENIEPRRHKLPSANATVVPTQASEASSAFATLVASRDSAATSQYFSNSRSSSSTASTGLCGLRFNPTTAQSSQAPVQNECDDEEEAMLNHFDSAVFLEAPDNFGPDENAPPIETQTLNPKSTPSLMLSSSRTRSSTESQQVTPTTHAFVLEDSIEIISSKSSSGETQKQRPATYSPVSKSDVEIISFASSEAPTRFRLRTQSKTKEKRKEKASNSNDRQSVTGSVIEVSDLEPLFLEDLSDEDETIRYIHPQSKLYLLGHSDRFGRSRSSTSPVPSAAALSQRRRERPIKPLPKPPKLLQSSCRGSPRSLYPQFKEIIEIGSDSSNSPSPRAAPLPEIVEGTDDDVEFLERSENPSDEEEQYDKENIPVMTRHVRRKIANTRDSIVSATIFGNMTEKEGGCSDNVIDLSD